MPRTQYLHVLSRLRRTTFKAGKDVVKVETATGAALMFIESEIIIGTMVELMRSHSVPCFSVHNSIIVKKKDQQIAMDKLENKFLGRTSIEPRLKVK